MRLTVNTQMESIYAENCIRTVSGLDVDVFNIIPEMVNIDDIAHALAHQCRFGGHCSEFYSVAQHSILCSKLASTENKLAALMHDASEAYLIDIPRPIKGGLANYKELEDKVMHVIAQKFGFKYPLDKEIKDIDHQMFTIEWHELMIKDVQRTIKCGTPEVVRSGFLSRFYALTQK